MAFVSRVSPTTTRQLRWAGVIRLLVREDAFASLQGMKESTIKRVYGA